MKIKIRLRYDPEFVQLRDAVTVYADSQLEQARALLKDYDAPSGLLRHVADLYELRDTMATDLAAQEKKGYNVTKDAEGSTTVDPKLLLEVLGNEGNFDPRPGWDGVLYQLAKALAAEGR